MVCDDQEDSSWAMVNNSSNTKTNNVSNNKNTGDVVLSQAAYKRRLKKAKKDARVAATQGKSSTGKGIA